MSADHRASNFRNGLSIILLIGGGLAFTTILASAARLPAQPLALTIAATTDQPKSDLQTETIKTATGVDKKLPEKISFNAHIRPIMSDTCFTCHGPDEEENASSLRLDSFTAAVDDGGAIEPGDANESLVYQRLIDSDSPMPPAEFRHQLSDYDIALFKKWIEQGANYEPHWSYAAIQQPAVPAVNHSDLVANPIDAFVLSRLELEGLSPTERADKATLLRRLSLDLIGLPPTPDEVSAFLKDDSPNAYQQQVERLLASPHYGERMASQWLDAVRFTDTVGFHGDQNQRVFAYRDYVIDSLNENKPFDQFTREQLAGDLLKNPTDEQRIATALIRLNMMTREGGAQPGEYLAKYTADRVRMLGTAWMGATTGCCECHNHKYDPLTAKDFYSLGAFFEDIRQWGVYTTYGYTPNPDLNGFNNDSPFPPELRAKSKSLHDQIVQLEHAMANRIAKQSPQAINSPEFKAWVSALARQLANNPDGWIPVIVTAAKTQAEKTSTKILPDHSVLLTGTPQANDLLTITARLNQPINAKAIRLEVLPDPANDNRVGRAKEGGFTIEFSGTVDRRISELPKPQAVRPRFVRIELDKSEHLSLAEVQVFSRDKNGQPENIAPQGTAIQSSTSADGDAKLAIDRNTDGEYRKTNSTTHTAGTSAQQWWEVDLGSQRELTKIIIWNRTDGDYGKRIKNYRLVLLDDQHRPIVSTSPDYPNPSTEFTVPATVSAHSSLDSLAVRFAQVDRLNPNNYHSGSESWQLQGAWRSGPALWQLPKDETKFPHTAVYQLSNLETVLPTNELTFKINSSDVGRVRISVSPLTRFVAGMPAASPQLISAVKIFQSGNKLSESESASLLSAFYLAHTPAGEISKDVKTYRELIGDCRSGYAMTMVADRSEPEKWLKSRVLPRGNWQDETGELVEPATPEFLPQLPIVGQRKLTRLDLADWLTSPDNPLVARHYVNRTWKHFFGVGLSSVLDDLGNQGEWPSHPELLDWLAAEFRNDWDLKHIARLIVTSNTYQQAVSRNSLSREIDPYNRLLSQQSPRRLEAESVRDNALAIAGLLNTKWIGGPSVFPYQPAGYYSNIQFPDRDYYASPVEMQYRRGVYMHWQRTFLHPMLVNFDAPLRDECAADRTGSNSPQQALTLLNDPEFVEASIAFADRLLRENPDADFQTRLERAFQSALARNTTLQEQEGLEHLFNEQKRYYAENDSEITGLLFNNSNFKPTVELDKVELSAWSQVCRVILNLHETITRY